MGQHKFNPVARAAKEGKIPAKPPRTSSAAVKRQIEEMFAYSMRKTPFERFTAPGGGLFCV